MTKVQKKYLKPGVAGLTVTALVIGLSSRLTQAQMIKDNTRGAKPARTGERRLKGSFDHRILQDEEFVSVMSHSSKSGKATPSPAPTDACSIYCFDYSDDCSQNSQLPACDGMGYAPAFDTPVDIALGARCRGYDDSSPDRPTAFCGTDNMTPNCPSPNGNIRRSVFVRVQCTPAPSPFPTSKSGKATPAPTDDCSESCFAQVDGPDSDDCDGNGQLPACDGSQGSIALGARCRGYNDSSPDRPTEFCGTDNMTPNCRSPNGQLRRSVYRKIDCYD